MYRYMCIGTELRFSLMCRRMPHTRLHSARFDLSFSRHKTLDDRFARSAFLDFRIDKKNKKKQRAYANPTHASITEFRTDCKLTEWERGVRTHTIVAFSFVYSATFFSARESTRGLMLLWLFLRLDGSTVGLVTLHLLRQSQQPAPPLFLLTQPRLLGESFSPSIFRF